MRQIYQNAEATVVYLGDEADNSFLAIAFLNNLMKRVIQKKEDIAKMKESRDGREGS